MDPIPRVRRLVEPGLRAAVARLAPPVRARVGYHLGWPAQDGRPAGPALGKLVRPTLAVLAAEAVGAPAECALPAAVAVELLHNFSLVHDDVIDGDQQRRNQPTLWSRFGVPAAILDGDALLVLAFQVLLDAPGEQTTAARLLSQTALDMAAGQDLDVGFEARQDISLDECLAMAAGKTAALIECACGLGALFAGAPPPVVARLRRFGWHLGLAFQLTDDLLGIWGGADLLGKPVRADLLRRKKTLPVVAALRGSGPASRELAARYARAEPGTETDLHQLADLVEEAGGRLWAERETERHFEAALAHIGLPLINPVELIAIAESVVKRDN